MKEIIVAEKPAAAAKIASAVAKFLGKKLIKRLYKKVPYYIIGDEKEGVYVSSGVGHLFTLTEKEKTGWKYPVFDIKWEPAYNVNKGSLFSKPYYNNLKQLSKKAKELTIACDYDIEGEVIGYTIMKYIFGKKDANRMKFSTLTMPDIMDAYKNKSKHIDWGQAYAGETRHKLDWFYGINLSRALTAAIRTTNRFKIMSIGRVQGPALKMIVDKEGEISTFKPKKYWQIFAYFSKSKKVVESIHIKNKFWDKKESDEVLKKIKDESSAVIRKITKREHKQPPPVPFDLTTLQTESYRCFKISPKEALQIAQRLYLAGAISYPRTSSQQLDPKIGYKKIISALSKQKEYGALCKEIMSKTLLKPNNGKKKDPAHPAIYPTGQMPSGASPRDLKIYDLIVKRFLSTFAPWAVKEATVIILDIKKEEFKAEGSMIKERGWFDFYSPYTNIKEVELPNISPDEIVKIDEIRRDEKETQPPKRYTQSSVIKELEKRSLGTKATRADIIDTLYTRGYITDEPIKATEFGIKTSNTIHKYCPEIMEEELTRDFEVEMENIREGKRKEEEILDKAVAALKKILKVFKKKEKDIGESLKEAIEETRNIETTLGKCPNCGKELKIQLNKKTRQNFIGCSGYPECKTTFSLPNGYRASASAKDCKECGWKMVNLKKGSRGKDICFNPDCKTHKDTTNLTFKNEGKRCDKCGKGKMVIKRSMFGEFLACDQYPKCKNIEKSSSKKRASKRLKNTKKTD